MLRVLSTKMDTPIIKVRDFERLLASLAVKYL